MKMKKILYALLIFSLLVSALTVTSAAAESHEAAVSEDYSYITYDGETYVRMQDLTVLNADLIYDVTFEGGNKKDVLDYEARINSCAIGLYVQYNNGGSGYYTYLKQSLLFRYNDFLLNGGDSYYLDSFHGTPDIAKQALFAKEHTIRGYELNYYRYVGEMVTSGFNGDIIAYSGYIMSSASGEYFYVDYTRSAPEGSYDDLTMYMNVKIWEITDQDVIFDIQNSEFGDPFGEGDIDIDYENGEGFGFGIIIFAIVLGVVPLAAGIVAFVISIKSTKEYKVLLRIVSALCAATFVIAIVTIIICLAIAGV